MEEKYPQQTNVLLDISNFLSELQEKYSGNDFNPTDIHLWKNGEVLFVTVKLEDNSEIFLERWDLNFD
jgi:hypothetical protein